MEIKFFTFSKRPNSTKTPVGSSATFSATWVARGAVDILNPVIYLAAAQPPITYNYAYIPDFGRYYFVKSWELVNDLWYAYMTCDVLASWKSPIGNSTLYITRAADTTITNGRISDAAYPTEATPQVTHTDVTEPWENSGSYVIGVSCSPPLGIDFGLQVGGTSYFVATPEAMSKLAKTLLSDSWTDKAISGNIDLSTFKAIYNPLQYIQSIMYYPYTVTNNNFGGSFYCGWYKVMDDAENRFLGVASKVRTFTQTVTLPKHPQAASRGAYLNATPYTEYTLYIPPFGTVTLDATRCAGSASVYMVMTVDQITGIAEMCIYTDSSETTLLSCVHGQVGIPVQLNQISLDHAAEALNNRMMFYNQVGGALGIAGGIASVGAGIAQLAAGGGGSGTVAGGIAGAVGAALSTQKALDTGIYNGLKLSAAKQDSAGSTGSFLYLVRPWRLDCAYQILVPEDIEHHGRPVYALHKISDVGGYLEVQDGDIECAALDAEREYIKTALETGIYYE